MFKKHIALLLTLANTFCKDLCRLSVHTFLHLDENQCLDNNGGCAHTCTNELPGFTCSCASGYRLDTDNRGCVGEFKQKS